MAIYYQSFKRRLGSLNQLSSPEGQVFRQKARHNTTTDEMPFFGRQALDDKENEQISNCSLFLTRLGARINDAEEATGRRRFGLGDLSIEDSVQGRHSGDSEGTYRQLLDRAKY